MPYGIPEALQEVVAAEEGYVAAQGVLVFDESKLPKVDWNDQTNTPPSTQIDAQFTGKALSRNGFTQSLDTTLTLEIKCFGPWCAGASSGKTILAFLKQTKQGYALTTTPCGGHFFYGPTRAQLNMVKKCYLTGTCPKSERP